MSGATKNNSEASDSEEEFSPVRPFKVKSQKKQIKKKELKKKKDTIYNDMPTNTIMNTQPNSVEDLVRSGGEGAIPHILPFDKHGKKDPPIYIQKNVNSYKKMIGKKDRFGKVITSKTSLLFGNPMTMPNYSSKEFAELDTLMKNMTDEGQMKINCFSKYQTHSKMFVIDCDSPEAMEFCDTLPLLKFCPRTTSASGKHHYYARRIEKDIGKCSTLLATNFYNAIAKKEYPDDKFAVKKYLEIHPKLNIDFIYSTNVFELRHDENGPRVVERWDGKFSSIPTISSGQINEAFSVRIPVSSSKEEKKICQENARAEQVAAQEMKQKTWTGAQFEVPAEADVVRALLEAVPNKDLITNTDWRKIGIVMVNQGTAKYSYLDDFQRKMNEVFLEVSTDGKFTSSNGKVQTWTIWKNENDRLWKDITASNLTHSGPKLTIKTLWDIVFKADRNKWLLIKRKQGGIPSERIMTDLKYYKEQKEYFEKFAHYTIGESEPIVSVHNFGLNQAMQMKKVQFLGQVWECVKTFEKQPKKDAAGEIVMDKNGNPVMVDFYCGKFPKVWLDDPEKRRYEREVFLPTGFEHADDSFAVQGESELNMNTWKGLAVENLMTAKDSPIMDMVEKQMAGDEEKFNDKYHSIRRIRELLYYLCGREKITFDYVELWISFNLKYPGLLTDTILLFRSIPGVGKNVFWDWLGSVLIGEDYYLSSGNPQAFFEKHSTAIEDKVMSLINEMNFKIMKLNQETIKTRATEASVYFNPKNLPARTKRNCCNMVMAMNGKNPPLEENQRRFCLIETDHSHKFKKDYFVNVTADMRIQTTQIIYYLFMKEEISCPYDYSFERNLPKTNFHKSRQAQGLCPVIKFGKHLMTKYNRALEKNKTKCFCDKYGYNGEVQCQCIFGLTVKGADCTEMDKFYREWKKWAADKGELGGADSVKNHSTFKASIASYTGAYPERKEQQKIWAKEEDSFNQFFLTTRNAKKINGEITRTKRVYFDTDRFCNFYSWNQEKETGDSYKEHMNDIQSIGTQNYQEKKETLEDFLPAATDGDQSEEEYMDPLDPAAKW